MARVMGYFKIDDATVILYDAAGKPVCAKAYRIVKKVERRIARWIGALQQHYGVTQVIDKRGRRTGEAAD